MPNYKSEADVRLALQRRFGLSAEQRDALPNLAAVTTVAEAHLSDMTELVYQNLQILDQTRTRHRARMLQAMLQRRSFHEALPSVPEEVTTLLKNHKVLAAFVLNKLVAVQHVGRTAKERKQREKLILNAYEQVCSCLILSVYLNKKPRGRLANLLVTYFTVPTRMIRKIRPGNRSAAIRSSIKRGPRLPNGARGRIKRTPRPKRQP